ncbi:hypothetical protein NMG60_11013397 [Bertholletia excelsa]
MEKENQSRLKLQISRMFRSSFNACKPRSISDVVDRPVFATQTRQHYQLIDLFSPKPRPFPSLCRPRYSEKPDPDSFPRRKVCDRSSLLAPVSGKCPPASPIAPPIAKPKWNRSRKKTNRSTHMIKKGSFESFDNYYDFFSSDDDETTLFSSKSLSSDSSDSFRRNKAGSRRRTVARKKSEMGLVSQENRMKDSFAVVKRSSDPYSDFKASMVEMIVEKQIFGARDLENLLQVFLSLNSDHHHRVIIEVFMEIWKALFSNRD